MKKKLLTVALTAVMALGSVLSAFATTADKTADKTVDKTVYSNTKDYALDGVVDAKNAIDNPLKGVETDKITIEYTAKTSQAFAAWKGLAQFYNEGDEGWAAGILLTLWPQMCHNGTGASIAWFELKGNNDAAPEVPADTLADGKSHTYKYVLTKSSCEIYVDGEAKKVSVNSDGNKTLEEICGVIFDKIISSDKFSLGQAVPGNKDWGELDSTSTINSFKILATVVAEPESSSKPSVTEPESTSKPSPDKEAETSKPSPDKEAETSKPSPDKEAETSSSAEKETTTKPADKETTTAADENAVVVTPVTEEEVKAIQEAIEIAGAVEGAKIVVKVPTTEAVAKAQEIIAKAIAAADKTADGIAVSVLKGKTADEIAVVDLTLTDKDGNPIQPEAGKKVKITLKTDSFKALKDAKYVAAFRVADDKLVSLGIVEVKDGKFTIETDHFSTYVFTSATEQQFKDYTAAVKADASVNDASGNKTGDSSPVMPLVVLAVVALGAVVAVVASKKRA